MKKKEERNEKHMSEIQAENKRLKEPLEKAKAEVTDLKKQLANYQKDKQSLQVGCLYPLCTLFERVRDSIRVSPSLNNL